MDTSHVLGVTHMYYAVYITLKISCLAFHHALLSILPFSDGCTPKAGMFFNEHQRSILWYLYYSKPYPTHSEKEKMANMLGLEYSSVTKWFRDQRRRTNQPILSFPSTQNFLGKYLQLKCAHVEKFNS